MNRRVIAALIASAVMIVAVIVFQGKLCRTASDFADQADRICGLFGNENYGQGKAELKRLMQSFSEEKTFFFFFANDARVHEIVRSLERALLLAEENDFSPALEALSDFSSAVWELSQSHVPSIGNIF